MVKHTQTISWQQPTNYFSVFDYFLELEPKGLSFYGLTQNIFGRPWSQPKLVSAIFIKFLFFTKR